MPGRRTSKFTKDQNALLQGEVMIILAESEEALTNEEIQARSITLTGLSTQKIARLLGHLIEMGNVTKAKSKSLGKMVYKSLAVMRSRDMMFIEDTYDVIFTIYLGNQVIEQWRMQAPRPFIEAQFIQIVQQIASQKQPMKVVVSREEVIWDQFEQKHKVLPITMEFQNYKE